MDKRDELIKKLKELLRIQEKSFVYEMTGDGTGLDWNNEFIPLANKLKNEIASLESELAKDKQDQEKELFDLEQKLDIAFKDRYYNSCPPNEDKNSKKQEPSKTAEDVLRDTFMQHYKESFINEIALKRAIDFLMLHEDEFGPINLNYVEPDKFKSYEAKLKEELIIFAKSFVNFKHESISYEDYVNDYLKQRNNGMDKNR